MCGPTKHSTPTVVDLESPAADTSVEMSAAELARQEFVAMAEDEAVLRGSSDYWVATAEQQMIRAQKEDDLLQNQ